MKKLLLILTASYLTALSAEAMRQNPLQAINLPEWASDISKTNQITCKDKDNEDFYPEYSNLSDLKSVNFYNKVFLSRNLKENFCTVQIMLENKVYTVKGKRSFWDNLCDNLCCCCGFSRSGGLFYDVVPFLQGGDPFKNKHSKKIIITPYALHITDTNSSNYNYIFSISPSYKKAMKKFKGRPVEISAEDFRSDFGVTLYPQQKISASATQIARTESLIAPTFPELAKLKICRSRLYRPTAVKSIIDPNFTEEDLELIYYY